MCSRWVRKWPLVPAESDPGASSFQSLDRSGSPHSNHYVEVETFNGCHVTKHSTLRTENESLLLLFLKPLLSFQ